MQTYCGLTRNDIIELIVAARVQKCMEENFNKFGNNDFQRKNENPDKWRIFYKKYPMFSKYPFCLSKEFDALCK